VSLEWWALSRIQLIVAIHAGVNVDYESDTNRNIFENEDLACWSVCGKPE
jgi:hypothetical protein